MPLYRSDMRRRPAIRARSSPAPPRTSSGCHTLLCVVLDRCVVSSPARARSCSSRSSTAAIAACRRRWLCIAASASRTTSRSPAASIRVSMRTTRGAPSTSLTSRSIRGPTRSRSGRRPSSVWRWRSERGQSSAARRAARQARSTRREFIQVLLEVVRSAGSTALLSPHVVTDVEDACDRLAIMGTREIGFQSSDSPKSEFGRRSGSAEN